MTRIPRSFPHLNGDLMCVIDLECTGNRAGYHEPVQIAILPIDADCNPHEGISPFYVNVQPQYPARADSEAGAVHKLNMQDLLLHGIHPDKVADLIVEWVHDLDLPFNRRVVPLAHNWQYESSFLKAWLGDQQVAELFSPHPRDTMLIALSYNDRAFFRGNKVPFNKVGLPALCRHFSVVNENPHDALSDCIATAEVYKNLLEMDAW
jgi:DNA polymerase III epsilon subunit-like protein